VKWVLDSRGSSRFAANDTRGFNDMIKANACRELTHSGTGQLLLLALRRQCQRSCSAGTR